MDFTGSEIEEEMESASSLSESSHTSLTELSDRELTESLYARVLNTRPVTLNGRAPTLQDIRVFLTEFQGAPNATERWLETAPKNAVSRYISS